MNDIVMIRLGDLHVEYRFYIRDEPNMSRELVQSIKNEGIYSPLSVINESGRTRINDGVSRFLIMHLLDYDLDTLVPCIVLYNID